MQDHVYGVILAGGGGTRLWPKSRQKTPKQFLTLYGNQTMIELTADRLNKIIPWERIIVVTNKDYLSQVKSLLPQVKTENILAEPAKRDTALAMLVGSLYAHSLNQNAVIVNAAADHVVQNESEYQRVMEAAVNEADIAPVLVTVGITPTYPSTGFGYIKVADELKKLSPGLSSFAVKSFTEKPNSATARAFLATGQYFWNANMYVWKSQVLLDAFESHHPELYQLTHKLQNTKGVKFMSQLHQIYENSPSISIDYAISEKAKNLILIPGDFGWTDIGEWKVVHELARQDLSGNAVLTDNQEHSPDNLLIKSQRNLIYSDQRKIVLLGVKDHIIIDTPDILFIAPIDQSQNVKEVVTELKNRHLNDQL